MSFNRLRYDNCSYQHELSESVGTLAYMLDPSRYENCNKCRPELGLVGGTNVSHVSGNLVDLESDLMGVTRLASKCPQLKYQNPCPKGEMNQCHPEPIVIKQTPNKKGRVVDTTMKHLPPCQFIRYKSIPLPPPMEQVKCNYFAK